MAAYSFMLSGLAICSAAADVRSFQIDVDHVLKIKEVGASMVVVR